MLNQNGEVREKLKQLGGHKGDVDPVDWLMGHDFGELQIGAKQGVATQVVLINQLNRLSRLGRGYNSGSGRSSSSGLQGRALSPRIGNGGKQALVKLIRKGGTQTARGLRDQLQYLNREGEVEVQRSERFFGAIVDDAEQESLIASWGLNRPNHTKSDKTSHFVVSFPPGTDRGDAERAGREWADRLFNSGDYGDVYDYYTVQHNDTAHPHMHVVVSRRGLENGEWLKLSKRGPIDFQVLRDIQVDAARNHGIHLEATPRFARGETDRKPTDVEVKRAEREERPVETPKHTEETATKAAVAVLSFATQISSEAAEISDKMPEIAKSMKMIAKGLRKGISVEEMLQSKKVMDLGEAKHMSHLLTESRNEVFASFKELDDGVKTLPKDSLERIQLERQISDNKAHAGRFIEQFRAEKTSAEKYGLYKGVYASDDIGNAFKSEADKEVSALAQSAGLDPKKTLARYNGGRAVTEDQAKAWQRDEVASGKENGIDEKQVETARQNIGYIYGAARNKIRKHEENKREIINDLKNVDITEDQDIRDDIASDRLKRIRNAITPQQREKLERGDVSQLEGFARDPHTQHVLAREYLNTAIKQAGPEQQVQLQSAKFSVEQQLQRTQEQAQKQRQQNQRAPNARNNGLER